MSKKLMIFGAVAAALVLLAAYLASPLLAANALKSAAQSSDADKLQRLVDFPAVRESLKGQLNAMVLQSIESDPDLKDNPFAGFAAVMAPALVNQAIEGYVTAEGLSAMMAANKPVAGAAPSNAPARVSPSKPPAASPEPVFEHRYKDLDTYLITSVSAENPKARFSFVLHRQGLFGWRLTRIELPKDLMAQAPAAPSTSRAAETAPAEPRALLDRWAQENEACRGGAGDAAATDRACAARDVTDAELQRTGWCYGENAAYGYQSEWRACGSPRFASVAEAEAAAEADSAANAQ